MSLGYAFQLLGIFECCIRLTLAVIVIVVGCIAFEEVLLLNVAIISGGLGNSCQLYGRFNCCVRSAFVVVVVVWCVSFNDVLLFDVGMILKSFGVVN